MWYHSVFAFGAQYETLSYGKWGLDRPKGIGVWFPMFLGTGSDPEASAHAAARSFAEEFDFRDHEGNYQEAGPAMLVLKPGSFQRRLIRLLCMWSSRRNLKHWLTGFADRWQCRLAGHTWYAFDPGHEAILCSRCGRLFKFKPFGKEKK